MRFQTLDVDNEGIQEQQAAFMDACGAARFTLREIVDTEECANNAYRDIHKALTLANELINEEVNTELRDNLGQLAQHHRHMAPAGRLMLVSKVADDIVDSVYVIMQLANTLGIDIQPVWDAVQRANMQKVGPDGKVERRGDGKILKPDGWTAPDVKTVILEQLEREEYKEKCK